jgi:hypothetical protein
MTGIANNAKEGKLDQFGTSVNSAAEAVCGLVESSAQAAYLVSTALFSIHLFKCTGVSFN